MIDLPDEFFQQMEKFTGPISDHDRRWFALLLDGATAAKARMTRSESEKALAGVLAEKMPERGRGRPRKTKPLPPRVRWEMMGKPHDDAVDAAREWLEKEGPTPARMDWERYFLISTLAVAWGSRFARARGKSLAYTVNHHGDLPPLTGPFFEAVKLCLFQLGRSDSDEAIAEAIRTARDRIFAL